MRPRSLATLLLLALVLSAPTAGAPVAAGGGVDALAPGADPTAVVLAAAVDPDGDATWQVRFRFALGSENATEAFEGFRADVEERPATYRDRFAARMNETVRGAEAATGREMVAHSFGVEAGTDPFTGDQGFVTYTFVWEGFAAANGSHLAVGDALDGLYLARNTTLAIAWPTGYEPASIRPAPTDASATEATWTGKRTFAPGTPRLVLVSASAPSGSPGPAEGGVQTGSAIPVGPTPLAVGAGSAVLVAGVAAWWFRGGLLISRGALRPGGPADGADGPPPELLSNEERVLRLLEDRAGRTRQQEIAAALDWSEMKTSNVVRGMREEGAVEVFRLGRENVVSLPDDDDI